MGKPAGDRLCRFFVSRETVGGVVLCLVKKFSLCQLVLLSRAVVWKPSGGFRSLHSLSAWGLPTPVVALACIGNVDIQVFSDAGC